MQTETMILVGKILFLFFAVMFTFVNVIRCYLKNDIPLMNFVIQAAGITGFVILQWII